MLDIYAANLRSDGLHTRAQHHPSRSKGATFFCYSINFNSYKHSLSTMLQPENILCLTESGNRVKIIDFGLAREYDPSQKLQVLFGTPEFGNFLDFFGNKF